MAVEPQQLRAALRCWASGVTIVTARSGERALGMTASAFSGVSVDPPLVLVCANKKAQTNALIAEAGHFAVNFLAHDQHEISQRFATDGNEAVRMEGLAWQEGPGGAPWLPGAVAVIDCKVVAAHEAGSHVIYVGEVQATRVEEGREPLLYHGGRYHTLKPR
jgi:flavin reductase (DIM6/NTAB) family NADH-FMN oxidoreductase RutF